MTKTFKKGLIVGIAIVSIVIGTIFLKPKYDNYINEKRCDEARINIRRIYDGEIAYYHYLAFSKSFKNVIPRFISAPSTPPGIAGKGKRIGNWEHPSWKALKFDPKKPVRFNYWVEASGLGLNSSFTAWAVGDVDGDGESGIFNREGSFDSRTGEIPTNSTLRFFGEKCD